MMQEHIDYVDVMTDEDVFQSMQEEDPEMRRMGNNLYKPFSADYLQGPDGTAIMQVRTRVAGSIKEYALTSETFIANLVAYIDEEGNICCFNPEVVNDVLLKSTKDFSEAISQETNKEATEEVTQQSISVKPEQRPSWMP
jgi:hypothetical protein